MPRYKSHTNEEKFRKAIYRDLQMQVYHHRQVKKILRKNHSEIEKEFGVLMPFGKVSWLQSLHDLNKEIISARLDYLGNPNTTASHEHPRRKHTSKTLYSWVMDALIDGISGKHNTIGFYLRYPTVYTRNVANNEFYDISEYIRRSGEGE
jgi:hypothetical protein